MGIIIFWIGLSILIGAIGSSRNIGFAGALLVSLFLTPLIGLIVTLASKDVEEEKRKAQQLINQQQQTRALQEMNKKSNQQNVTDELERIAKLKEQGNLTEEEYQKLKNAIISKFD